MKLFSNRLLIATLLLAAFLFRVAIVALGFHVDLYSIGDWTNWLYKYGTQNFYTNNIWTYSWPTQPPLLNLVLLFNAHLYEWLVDLFGNIGYFIAINRLGASYLLWFYQFADWFSNDLHSITPIRSGLLISIKLVAILADLGIAFVMYQLARKKDVRLGLIIAALYLFSPFSWYLSALWGQYDQLSFIILLLSFLALYKRMFIVAPLLFCISIGAKPTGLLFAPLFVFIYFKSRPLLHTVIVAAVCVIGMYFYTTQLFTLKNPYEFISGDLKRIIFDKAELRVSTNSFNFWHILIGNKAVNQETQFLLIPAKIWGYFAMLLLHVLAINRLKKISLQNLFSALFIVSAGGWLFMTNMLERYLFAGVVSLLFLCIYNRNFIKYWIILSCIFWLNLFHGWWFPESFNLLQLTLEWQAGLLPRVFSLVNIAVFLRVLYLISKEDII